ncbi:MAG: type II toxin-antitoxin system RelE/ParE family toxin [Thermomicrobiales bacterium]
MEEIGLYTIERWGFDHWVTYLNMLTEAFETIAMLPHIGKPLAGIQENVRSYSVGRHMIRYTTEPDGSVTIVRVLHVRRMPPR